jgi:hypothetical protein
MAEWGEMGDQQCRTHAKTVEDCEVLYATAFGKEGKAKYDLCCAQIATADPKINAAACKARRDAEGHPQK